MYFCNECKSVFYAPTIFTETHGFTEPPYEHFYICPRCSSTNFSESERRRRYAK